MKAWAEWFHPLIPAHPPTGGLECDDGYLASESLQRLLLIPEVKWISLVCVLDP